MLGVVTDKHADDYRVEIRASSSAILSALAFEGATKRSRPRLQIGTIVYARVSLAVKDCEPELTCISLTNKKVRSTLIHVLLFLQQAPAFPSSSHILPTQNWLLPYNNTN